MKKVLLLFTKSSVEAGYANPAQLAKLLENSGYDLRAEWGFYEDLAHVVAAQHAAIVNTVAGTDIADYSFVYHRRWQAQPAIALACAIYLKIKGIKQIDSEVYLTQSLTKLTQYWKLYEHGLSFPDTVYLPSDVPAEKRTEYLSHIEYPVVVKAVDGTRGESNYLAHSITEVTNLLGSNDHPELLIQKFIENDGDYRVVTMGGKAKLVIKRHSSPGSHLNNISQGAGYKKVNMASLPENLLQDSERAAKLFSRDVAGVDVVVDNISGRHFFFEINRSPQIEEAALPAEKADILAEYISSSLNDY